MSKNDNIAKFAVKSGQWVLKTESQLKIMNLKKEVEVLMVPFLPREACSISQLMTHNLNIGID